MTQQEFGRLTDGTPVTQFTFANRHGLEVRILDLGGILVSVRAPDRVGRFDNVVLGCCTADDYLHRSPHFGSIVGRYSNRIAAGRFTLDGRTYQLATNNGVNHLHGGRVGFDRVMWRARPSTDADGQSLVLTRVSPDGEEGYPGRVDVEVRYTLTDANVLSVMYRATTDAATPINLTQHSYFNLAGDGSGDVLGHRVSIHAAYYLPVSETLIPLGVRAPVAGTPFDFIHPHAIGERIEAPDEQLRRGEGYDHTFIIDRGGPGLDLAARAVDPSSGRTLEVRTTEPGVHFYTGNHLNGAVSGPTGRPYTRRTGVCFEAQHFPDSPNQPDFPSTILRPGQVYQSQTTFAFGVE